MAVGSKRFMSAAFNRGQTALDSVLLGPVSGREGAGWGASALGQSRYLIEIEDGEICVLPAHLTRIAQ